MGKLAAVLATFAMVSGCGQGVEVVEGETAETSRQEIRHSYGPCDLAEDICYSLGTSTVTCILQKAKCVEGPDA